MIVAETMEMSMADKAARTGSRTAAGGGCVAEQRHMTADRTGDGSGIVDDGSRAATGAAE